MHYITIAIAIIGCVISVISFFGGKTQDKAKETKEEQREYSRTNLIEYRLNELEKKLDKVLDILDGYDKEIEKIVDKKIEEHILIYHKNQ